MIKTNPLGIALLCPLCKEAVEETAVLPISQPAKGWIVVCEDGAWCHMISSRDGIERLVFMTGYSKTKLGSPVYHNQDYLPY